MAAIILTDCRFYLDGYDLSADGNDVQFHPEVDTHDVTTFTKTTRINKAGLFKGGYSYKGFQQYGTGLVDDVLRARLGTAGIAILAAADGGDVGERCAFCNTIANQHTP